MSLSSEAFGDQRPTAPFCRSACMVGILVKPSSVRRYAVSIACFESTQSTYVPQGRPRCLSKCKDVTFPHQLLLSCFDSLYRSLQYVNRAAGAVRSALKEPTKSKLMAQSEFKYNASAWEAGVQGAKKEVTSLSQAGK